MNRAQVTAILALAAGYDRRKVGDSETAAWKLAIGDLDFERAKQAVITHYSHSTDYLMPAHVRALATTRVGPAGDDFAGCDYCRAIHEPDEPCDVLKPAPADFRGWANTFRRPPEAS